MGKAGAILKDLRDHILNESSESTEVISSVTGTGKRKRNLVRYMSSGNTHRPAGDVKTEEALESGVYNIGADMNGLYFELHELTTDELLRFSDSRYNKILDEIAEFWKLKERYKEMGFTHKRGVLLHGAPGTGKSCLLKLVMESVVSNGDVVFISNEPDLLVSALKQFREVEPDRRILTVMEDVDKYIRYGENVLLSLMDGDTQVDGLLVLGTTNYLESIPERMTRTGRFDRVLEVHSPPKDGRKAYLRHKIGMFEEDDRLDELSEKTDGFNFAELKEFLISVYCFNQSTDEAISKIKNHRKE